MYSAHGAYGLATRWPTALRHPIEYPLADTPVTYFLNVAGICNHYRDGALFDEEKLDSQESLNHLAQVIVEFYSDGATNVLLSKTA